MKLACTEPCKILDGRWPCRNCKRPRATRWGTIMVGGKEREGWWCQNCINWLLRPLPDTKPAC